MRIYSQIKNPSEPLPPAEQNRQSQFSFHQSNSDLPHSQISEGSSRQQKNKFSFRLQPELYFQRNNPQKDKLYPVESHIRLASSSSESSPRQLSQQIKSMPSRKKIFDESMRITVLNEEGEKVQKVQPDLRLPPQIKEAEQPAVRKAEEDQKRLLGILKKKTQPQQPVSMASNSSFQQSRERSRRNIHRVQFVHEDTDKYLTQPILHEPNGPRMDQSLKQSKQAAFIPLIDNASLVEKINRNEQSIMELQERLNRKISEDERRNDQIMRMLSQNTQRGQREQERHRQEEEIAKIATQKAIERERISLQIQQSKRLQQLILENRHLCAKVLQQSQRTPTTPTPEELHIEQRIRELQSMRLNLQLNRSLNQSQSLHLNETIIPARPLEGPTHLTATLKPDWRHPQVGYSALSAKLESPTPNLPTFQMIPEHDVTASDPNTSLRRVVLVSKIY